LAAHAGRVNIRPVVWNARSRERITSRIIVKDCIGI